MPLDKDALGISTTAVLLANWVACMVPDPLDRQLIAALLNAVSVNLSIIIVEDRQDSLLSPINVTDELD